MEKLENQGVNTEKEKSMKYCNFFYKIFLVLVLIWNIFALSFNLKDVGNISNDKMWNVPLIIFVVTVVIGNIFNILIAIKLKDELELKTRLGYKLVLVFFIFNYIYRIVISTLKLYTNNIIEIKDIEMYIAIYFILYSFWYIPNLIYFSKRKEVFINDKHLKNNTKSIKKSSQIPNNIEKVNVESEKDTKANKQVINKKWKIGTIVLIITNIVTAGVLTYECMKNFKHNEVVEELQQVVKVTKKERDEYSNKYKNVLDKVEFFNKYIVIVTEYTKIYHKYDCLYCDKSSFYIFVIDDAKSNGYKPCSHCIK